jgi:hypothetical protein
MAHPHYLTTISLPPAGKTPQTIYDSILAAFPRVPGGVVGIAVPPLGIQCKETGLVRPYHDIKEAAILIYNNSIALYFQPIFKLFDVLIKFLGGIFDKVKLGFLDLDLEDLFSGKDLWDKIMKTVTNWYETAKDKLKAALKALGIDFWPFFTDTFDIQKEIYTLVKMIMVSLWSVIVKWIIKIIGYITTLAEIRTLYYAAQNNPLWQWCELLVKTIKGWIAGMIAGKFLTIPDIGQIKRTIEEFAKKLFNSAVLTYKQLIEALTKFKFPIIGLPLQLKWPLDGTSFPNIDYMSLIADVMAFMADIYMNMLGKLIKLILDILKVFGLNFTEWLGVKVPIELCYIPNTAQSTAQPMPTG